MHGLFIKTLKFPIRTITLSCAISAALLMSACGIKGDLKRPGPIFDKSSKTKPVASPTSQSVSPNSASAGFVSNTKPSDITASDLKPYN